MFRSTRSFSTLAAVTAVTLCALLPAFRLAAEPIVIDVEEPERETPYHFAEELVLGGPDAPEAEQFYETLGSSIVTADAKGMIYVLDGGNHRVQVFDPDGAHVRSIGGEGEGPGEFRMPRHMAVSPGGQVAVFDMVLQRVSIFDPSGALVRDQIVTGGPRGIALDADGGLVVAYSQHGPAIVQHYTPAGDLAWSFQPREHAHGRVERVMEFDTGSAAARLALLPDGGAVLPQQGVYEILRVSSSGDALAQLRRTFERQKFEMPKPKDGESGPRMVMVKKEEGGPQGSSTTVETKSWKDGEGDIDMSRLAKMMPEFRSDLNGVLTWPDGRIWVTTSQSDGDKMIVDEWSSENVFTNRFAVPERYGWLAVGADGKLYAVGHDDDDFPLIYRLGVALTD